MFDLVATRLSTDEHARGCARLLTAVISSAIHDVCLNPTKDEAARQENLRLEARQAIEWLFDDGDITFRIYAKLIGANHITIREALLNRTGTHALYSDIDRRVVRARHHWYTKEVACRQQD